METRFDMRNFRNMMFELDKDLSWHIQASLSNDSMQYPPEKPSAAHAQGSIRQAGKT